mgnify:CR=1 FL=1
MTTSTERPHPLRDIARYAMLATGVLGGVVSFLLTNQVLSVEQAAALTTSLANFDVFVAALNRLITAGAGVAGAFIVSRSGESKVTPIADPRVVDELGKLLQLVPVVPTAGHPDSEATF